MTACPCYRLFFAAALAIALVALGHRGLKAADNPQGKQIAEIIPIGNKLHTSGQILQQMHTRVGNRYDEATIQEDVRRLYNTRWFTPSGIRILTQHESDGRVTVMVHVTELTSVIQEVVYAGAEHLGPSDLHTLTGLRKGDPMSPYINEMGRKAILRKYQEDGRYFASVELVEGSKPTDTRVVYNIVEGPMVKVAAIKFVGNDHTITGRLQTQVVTKREFLRAIGGKFNPASIDLDIKALIEYYHMLGYLAVQIQPEVQRSADMHHVTIVYHINEGMKYYVAEKVIDGNKSVPTQKLEGLTELQVGETFNGK